MGPLVTETVLAADPTRPSPQMTPIVTEVMALGRRTVGRGFPVPANVQIVI
jgi:hypothetical protein